MLSQGAWGSRLEFSDSHSKTCTVGHRWYALCGEDLDMGGQHVADEGPKSKTFVLASNIPSYHHMANTQGAIVLLMEMGRRDDRMPSLVRGGLRATVKKSIDHLHDVIHRETGSILLTSIPFNFLKKGQPKYRCPV